MSARDFNNRLALAVIAQAPRLEYRGQAELLHGARKFALRADSPIARGRDAQGLEQAFFRQTVLAGGECRQRRCDAGPGAVRLQRVDRDVFPVEGHDLAAPGKFAQQLPVGEFASQYRADLAAGSVGGAVQKQAVNA